MAHCFSVVDNLDGKFVKAIIELPFTAEFDTDGWLPNIVVNLHGSHEQLKKSLNFALRIERGDNTCHQFLSSHECLATKPRYATERPNELTHKFSDLNSFNWKNAGEKFIGESGLVFNYVFVPFLYVL